MSRPSLPKSHHFLVGTDKKNPARMKARENEPENTNPLGNPPTALSKEEKKYWLTIKNESIEGVLGEADRVAVSLASKLMVKVYSTEGATASEMGLLIKLLSQFGMTPADRAKLNIPKPKSTEPDPWDLL